MYLVTMYNGANDAQSTTIHSSRSGGIKLVDGIINQEVNKIPSFSFVFLPNNPAFGNILPYKTTFEVFNTVTGQYEFIGRATRPDESMDEDLTFATEWEAEGELGYLKDSVQPHFEFRGTVEQAFRMQIENHNRMVEDFKHFELGVVEVTDPNDYLYFYLMQTENTLDSIQRTLIDKLGGELRIRHENGIRYLDYVLIDGDVGNAEILIKKNLLSVSKSIDVTDTITRLVPLGNRIESEDEQATDASQKRLTIASVNDGKDYIDSDDLIGYYTIRMGAKVWDDINTPQALMTSGSNWLENQSDILAQYEVKAIDLGIKDPTLDPYICGWFYRLYNPYMRIDEVLRIVKKQIDINSPQNDKIMIGDIIKSATEIDQELRRQNQMAYSMLELERTKLEREVKAVTLTAQTIQEENKDLKENVIPQMNKSYNDLNKSYKDVLERLKRLETTVPPTPPTDSNGYATSRVFPVDYTLPGINFFVRAGKSPGSIEYDMTYGMRDGVLHSGQDIGTNGDRNYTAHATTDGVVRKAEFMSGGIGNAVYVEHTADGYWSNYMHLKSINVSVGQTVKAGDVIGVIGGTGGDYAPHLHFELSPDGVFHSGGNTINPQNYLGIAGDNTTSLPRPV